VIKREKGEKEKNENVKEQPTVEKKKKAQKERVTYASNCLNPAHLTGPREIWFGC